MRILRWIDKHLEITLMVISLVAICFFYDCAGYCKKILGIIYIIFRGTLSAFVCMDGLFKYQLFY